MNDNDPQLDLPVAQLKYIGPYLAQRFRTHSLWPPGSHNPQLYSITTLRDLLNFVRTRRGQNVRSNLSRWLQLIASNAREGECVTSRTTHPDHPGILPNQYRIRAQNLYGHTMVLNFLRQYLPPNHLYKLPARQSHPTSEAYQRPCSNGLRRPALAVPPRQVMWKA